MNGTLDKEEGGILLRSAPRVGLDTLDALMRKRSERIDVFISFLCLFPLTSWTLTKTAALHYIDVVSRWFLLKASCLHKI